MAPKYITVERFDDLVKNQEQLVEVLNHNISEIKKDVGKIAVSFAETKGKVSTISKLVWTLVGLFGTITTAAIISIITERLAG